MSFLVNAALGGLTGATSGLPVQALTGSAVQEPGGTIGNAPISAAGIAASRDGQIADLGDLSSSVNLLQEAASALGGNAAAIASSQPLLNLPPLPPMPAPAKPPDVPTDDHGQSNIVFADADSDGSLIH